MRNFRFLVLAVFLLPTFLGLASADEIKPIQAKTLVVWAAPDNLDQRGGSALTIDNLHNGFDGIVFGEKVAKRWMAGSNGFSRTQADQKANAEETAGPSTFVQIAIVYDQDGEISIYRDAKPYVSYMPGAGLMNFGPESVVMIGKRHVTGNNAAFTGAIDDARIYDRALTLEQIAALKPNRPSKPAPVAWWTFEDGSARDLAGRFVDSVTMGDVKVVDGKLVLRGEGTPTWMAMPRKNQILAKLNQAPKGENLIGSSRKIRKRLLADPYRPTYHFVTPEGCAIPFDPNGAIFWNGEYHLGYIFTDERGCCWGHVSSNDLLHWRWHEPWLVPSPDGPDRGIFSGSCFVNKKGEATMLFHGVGAGNCIATCSDPNLDHWTKLPSNPIVPNPADDDPNKKKFQSWDPHGWVEGDTYYAVFGGTPPSVFKAKTLDKWEYVGPFLHHQAEGVDDFEDLSCPDFFKLGDKYMMLGISHPRGCRYYLGDWKDEQFHPETHGRMNWPGGTFFAPESLVDNQGRRIMWAWVLHSDLWTAGSWNPGGEWCGTMSLPRVLSLARDGSLKIEPIEELKRLRKNEKSLENLIVKNGQPIKLDGIEGNTLELNLKLRPGKGVKRFGLKVCCSPDGKEETPVVVDLEKKSLVVDVSKSSTGGHKYREFVLAQGRVSKDHGNPELTKQEAPFELADGETLDLTVYIDRSILEVFANDRQALCQRIYPADPKSFGIVLFAKGGDVQVESLQAWEIVPTNAW